MKYCKNYQRLEDLKIITEVIIPPSQVSRLELYVMQLMFQLGGKGLNIGMGVDGSMLIEAFFYDDAKRQEFCETLEKAIDAGQPISVTSTTGENGEEMLELKINLKFMFAEFQAIMDKIQPVIQFIDANGGWLDEETGNFLGVDALETAQGAETLPKDVEEAIGTFGTFMGAYMIGSKLINGSSIVPHNNGTENTEQ